jgi:hypothetical protein
MPVGRTNIKTGTKGPGPTSALGAAMGMLAGAPILPKKRNQPSDFGLATAGKMVPDNMLGRAPAKKAKAKAPKRAAAPPPKVQPTPRKKAVPKSKPNQPMMMAKK